MAKAAQMAHLLPFPFLPRVNSDPERHSQVMGAIMLLSAGLLCFKSKGMRVAGTAVAGGLLSGWVYVFWQLGAEWPVPLVNVVLSGMVIYGELR